MGFFAFLSRRPSNQSLNNRTLNNRTLNKRPFAADVTRLTDTAYLTPSHSSLQLPQSYEGTPTRHGLLRRQLSTRSASPALKRATSQQTVSTTEATAVPPRSVDLLDAISTFKPADFRGRVQASGSRDYGEDVAERNLGQNGVDLQSDAVKRFYAEEENRTPTRTRRNSLTLNIGTPAITNTSKLNRTYSLSSAPPRPHTSQSFRSSSRQSARSIQTLPTRRSPGSIGQPRLEPRRPPVAMFNVPRRSASPPNVPRYPRPESAASQRSIGHHSRFSRDATYVESIAEHDTDDESYPAPISTGVGMNDIRNWGPVVVARQSEYATPLSPRQQSFGSGPAIDLESLHSVDSDEEQTEEEDLSDAETIPAVRSSLAQSVDFDEIDDGYTTDGSNVEAFLAKQSRRVALDGEALLFDTDIFNEGALPGLGSEDGDASPAAGSSVASSEYTLEPAYTSESDEPTSPATPTFGTQRQRMLALGFDYASDSDEETSTKHRERHLGSVRGLDLDAVMPSKPIKRSNSMSDVVRRRRQEKRVLRGGRAAVAAL